MFVRDAKLKQAIATYVSTVKSFDIGSFKNVKIT